MVYQERIINVYENREGKVTSVSLKGINIIPSVSECRKYKIIPYMRYQDDILFKVYELRKGYIVGVQLA